MMESSSLHLLTIVEAQNHHLGSAKYNIVNQGYIIRMNEKFTIGLKVQYK